MAKTRKPKAPTADEAKAAIKAAFIEALVKYGPYAYPEVDAEVLLGAGPAIQEALTLFVRARRRW